LAKLICTVGLPGAGKSIIVKAAKRLDIPVYIMGDIIREKAKEIYGKDDAYHTGIFMKEIREKHGRDIVAKLVLDKVKDISSDYILIDGLRNLEELDFFKKSGYDVIVIGILAKMPTRFSRLMARNRRDDIKNLPEFLNRERREREIGITRVLRRADYFIINEDITEKEGVEEAIEMLRIIMEREK
jgi:dephospho-CoA kinase